MTLEFQAKLKLGHSQHVVILVGHSAHLMLYCVMYCTLGLFLTSCS